QTGILTRSSTIAEQLRRNGSQCDLCWYQGSQIDPGFRGIAELLVESYATRRGRGPYAHGIARRRSGASAGDCRPRFRGPILRCFRLGSSYRWERSNDPAQRPVSGRRAQVCELLGRKAGQSGIAETTDRSKMNRYRLGVLASSAASPFRTTVLLNLMTVRLNRYR